MKKQRLAHADFREGGVYSIWLGTFTDEEQMDEYLRGDFRRDFGFAVEEGYEPEYSASPTPRPIANLLKGFSGWKEFLPAAVEAAKSAGHSQANCAVVFRSMRYQSQYAKKKAPMTFIGAFDVVAQRTKN